jgi:DNA-binding transcriptional ArsR family regulator
MNRRDYREAAHWFFVLSHPVRLQILNELLEEDKCVCDLQTALHRPQCYVSQQLRVLRTCGMIECHRRGSFHFYRLADPTVRQVLRWVRERQD